MSDFVFVQSHQFCRAVMASNAPCVAFVVKSRPIPDRSLLIIDKKDVLGLFTTSSLPPVGAFIVIEWTRSPSKEATVVVSKWESYDEYDPFWKLNAKNFGGVTKFTGCFYTTGCVCHRGVPLENPAIFNDYIGIVRDERRVLQRNYIGKVTATVIFVEDASGSYWNLENVDEGCHPIDAANSKKYRGILHAVGKGQTQTSHFITSRSFPSDILLRTRRDENINDVEALYGREVAFEVRVDKSSGVWYVAGRPLRAESNLQTIFTEKFISTTADPGDDAQSLNVNTRSTATENHSTKSPRKYFSIRTSVEFRGARDDGNLLVWSSELEIIVDTFNLFKDRDHGVYLIDAVRYFEKEKFPRWKVFRIHDLVGKFETLSTACQDVVPKPTPRKVTQQKRDDTTSSNRIPAAKNSQPSTPVNDQQQRSSHSSVKVKKEPPTKQIVQQESDVTRRSNQSLATGSYQPSMVVNDQQRCFPPYSSVSAKKGSTTKQQLPARTRRIADGERRSDQPSSTDSRQTSSSSVGQQQRSNSSHSSASADEKSLRLLFEKCLVDENVRNALMQANPDLFESLVDNMMNTD